MFVVFALYKACSGMHCRVPAENAAVFNTTYVDDQTMIALAIASQL